MKHEHDVRPEKKEVMLKTLAILGFIGIIALIAWLSVQIVSYAPTAFTSLASLADGIGQYRNSLVYDEVTATLTLTSNVESVEAGKPTTITWEKPAAGRYSFQYACRDGVSVEVIVGGARQTATCDAPFDLGDTDSMTIVFASLSQLEVPVTYTITFESTDAMREVVGTDTVVVMNASNTGEDGTVLGENDSTAWQDDIITVPEQPTTPETPPAPSSPPQPTYVYEIPVSNPRGFTDLQTAFLNVGEIRNNTFTVTSLREERDGAFQFSVKNIGTKTSERWTYTVELPDGDSYTSSSQAPLKPNERAVITIGFAVPGISVHTFEVDVDVDDDRNRNNNSFERRVSVQR